MNENFNIAGSAMPEVNLQRFTIDGSTFTTNEDLFIANDDIVSNTSPIQWSDFDTSHLSKKDEKLFKDLILKQKQIENKLYKLYYQGDGDKPADKGKKIKLKL